MFGHPWFERCRWSRRLSPFGMEASLGVPSARCRCWSCCAPPTAHSRVLYTGLGCLWHTGGCAIHPGCHPESSIMALALRLLKGPPVSSTRTPERGKRRAAARRCSSTFPFHLTGLFRPRCWWGGVFCLYGGVTSFFLFIIVGIHFFGGKYCCDISAFISRAGDCALRLLSSPFNKKEHPVVIFLGIIYSYGCKRSCLRFWNNYLSSLWSFLLTKLIIRLESKS